MTSFQDLVNRRDTTFDPPLSASFRDRLSGLRLQLLLRTYSPDALSRHAL